MIWSFYAYSRGWYSICGRLWAFHFYLEETCGWSYICKGLEEVLKILVACEKSEGCVSGSIYWRPVEGILSVEKCKRFSVCRRHVEGILSTEYMRKSLIYKGVVEGTSGRTCSKFFRKRVLSVENMLKVLYPEKTCGRTFIFKGPIKGILSVTYFWRLFICRWSLEDLWSAEGNLFLEDLCKVFCLWETYGMTSIYI